MPFKILGCILILTAGGCAALWITAYEKKRIFVLDGWLEMIFYIKTQIDCYLTPLDQILCNAKLSLIKNLSRDAKILSLPLLLRRTSFYLSEDGRRLLEAFSGEIGSSYREEQVKRCDYYITALRNIREKQIQELPMRIRVRVSLCLCAAFCIVILLW